MIKEARDKEYRHLNRRLHGYNRRQATDVQMIRNIQDQEKKANNLLEPKNTIFGGRYVQMLIDENSINQNVLQPTYQKSVTSLKQ